jgi:hypothetical protein
MTLLPNGKVLVAGGMIFPAGMFSSPIYTNSTEMYDPLTGTWTPNPPLAVKRGSHTATLLPNGKVLITGGRTNGGSFLALGPTVSAELYDPGLGFSNSWQPQISSPISSLGLGGTLAISGLRFRGIGGASGGTTQDSPTDFPVLQIQAVENGQIAFLPSVSWTTNSFTSAALTNFPVGYAFVRIVVNGIPSAASMSSVSATPIATAIFLSNPKRLPSGLFQFSFTNTPGAAFTALSFANLTTPVSNWTALGPVTETSPGTFQFTDPQSATNALRFFGVRSP